MQVRRSNGVRIATLVATLTVALGACAWPAVGPVPAGVGSSAVGAPPAAPSSRPIDPTGADTKRVCVYAYHRIDRLNDFARQVGRDIDCALVYNNASPTWAGWVQPWFVVHGDPNVNWAKWARADARRKLIITQSLVPSGMPSDWRQRGAAGEYDAYVRTLGENLVAAGLGGSVIRLAHEANGGWSVDGIGSTPDELDAWRTYWARTVRIMRSVPGARFTFDWTVNANYRPIPFDSYYPGDDVVDIVGIDAYDFWPWAAPPTNPGARFFLQYLQPFGLRDLVTYAEAHRKPLSISEWGLSAVGHKGGVGDNPTFVDGIAAIVRSHRFAYQSYFQSTTDVGMLLTDAPRSLAAYRRHFGTNGGAGR